MHGPQKVSMRFIQIASLGPLEKKEHVMQLWKTGEQTLHV